MRKSVGMLLLAFWAFSLCRVPVAVAVEAVPLPPQVPAHTASGATNLTDVWLHSGGGRLYWNTLVTPRQIALEGARFVDPAAVPELSMTPQADKKPPVRQAKRKVKVSKAAPQSKTSLPAPVSSAIPPMNNAASAQAPSGASATGPAKSANAAPAPSSAPMPYSSAAASSVGSIGGAGGGAMPDVPAPSAFSADDVLPRANARP